MDWLVHIMRPEILALLIPVCAIVGGFVVSGLKAHHRHQERLEKIRHGIDPDASN